MEFIRMNLMENKLQCSSDLKSECEKEMSLLQNDIDDAFEQKHAEILDMLTSIHSINTTQKDEIKKLKRLLGDTQVSQKEYLSEKIKQHSSECENLRKENMHLRSENYALFHKTQKFSEMEHQLQNLKRSLSIQQEENNALRERLLKNREKYEDLEKEVIDDSSTRVPDFAVIGEKFVVDQEEFEKPLLDEINQEVEGLAEKINEIIS